MEDAKHKPGRVLTVERGFEWSRIEAQVMASVYEYALPAVRAAPGESVTGQAQAGSKGQHRTTRDEERYATGA